MYYARHHNKQNMMIFSHHFCMHMTFVHHSSDLPHECHSCTYIYPRGGGLDEEHFRQKKSPLSTRLTSQMDVMSVCHVELYTMSTVVSVGV